MSMFDNGMIGGALLAQATRPDGVSVWEVFLAHLLSGVVFSVVGLVVFLIALWGIVRLAPFPIVKEIEEDQNTALAIIIGSVLIGIVMIIASAIQG